MLRADVVGTRSESGAFPAPRAATSRGVSGAHLLGGRYEILEQLGVGGMAEVWKARTRDAAGREHLVAIKRLSPELEHDRSVVSMFLDEARLAAQLSHPGIVGLEEVGRDESGRAYMVLEYVDGHDLRWCLATAARARYWLPVELSLTVMRDLLRALAFAHDASGADGEPLHVVHRDVSHSNVFIAKNGRVKLADFGIARARGRASQTRTGMVKGKIGYLSPEQVRAEALDRRSDVFSAGVVLWELLTQRRMFVGETDFKTMLAVCRDPRRPPSSLRPGLPPEIDALVLKSVHIDREQRWASAEAFEDAITDVAQALDLQLGPHITTTVLGYLREVHELTGGDARPGDARGESQPLTVEVPDPFALAAARDPFGLSASRDLLAISASGRTPQPDQEPSDAFARMTSDLDETTGGERSADGAEAGAEADADTQGSGGFSDGEPTETGLVPSNPALAPALASGAVRRTTMAGAPLLGLRIERAGGGRTERAHTFTDLVRMLFELGPGASDEILVDGQRVVSAVELIRLLGLDLAWAMAPPPGHDRPKPSPERGAKPGNQSPVSGLHALAGPSGAYAAQSPTGAATSWNLPSGWVQASGLEPTAALAEAALSGRSSQVLSARHAIRAAIFSQGVLVGVASRAPDEQLAVVLAAASPEPASAPLARLIREVATRRRPLVEIAAAVVGIAPEAVGGLHTGLELELLAEVLRMEPQALLRRETASPLPAPARPALSGLIACSALAWPEETLLEALSPLLPCRVGLSTRAAFVTEALGSTRVVQPVLAAIQPGFTLEAVRAAAPPTLTAARVLLLLVATGALRLR